MVKSYGTLRYQVHDHRDFASFLTALVEARKQPAVFVADNPRPPWRNIGFEFRLPPDGGEGELWERHVMTLTMVKELILGDQNVCDEMAASLGMTFRDFRMFLMTHEGRDFLYGTKSKELPNYLSWREHMRLTGESLGYGDFCKQNNLPPWFHEA